MKLALQNDPYNSQADLLVGGSGSIQPAGLESMVLKKSPHSFYVAAKKTVGTSS